MHAAIDQIAQTTLRKVVGKHTLDQALADTDVINADIRRILDATTVQWGVEVTLVEQSRNLQTLVELGVDKNTTVVSPAPLMSTISDMGNVFNRETAAAAGVPDGRVDTERQAG
ncbi:hypothetical protein GCM10023147_24560 [Tsukamurella soli]|uniref:Band 7 domain-containing protein n=1 Tax=Tsukamurella soli TaxID=644556 RepID=A0ABP8JNL7_9ACTN